MYAILPLALSFVLFPVASLPAALALLTGLVMLERALGGEEEGAEKSLEKTFL